MIYYKSTFLINKKLKATFIKLLCENKVEEIVWIKLETLAFTGKTYGGSKTMYQSHARFANNSNFLN